MKKFLFTGRAKKDLADIRRFSQEQWGNQKAEAYLSKICEKIRLAALHPSIGIDSSESLKLGLEIRSILCASHIIYYTVLETHISVVAILHQHMAPKLHLF